MRRLAFILFCACLGLIATPSPVRADSANSELEDLRSKLSAEWLLVKYDRTHNIRTYARVEDGKRYRSFKVEATLDTPVEPLARVLLDFNNYTRWFWKTRESTLIRQDSPTEYFLYMVHSAPYGLPDRDTVIRATVEPQGKNHPYVILRTTAVPDQRPLRPPFVRVAAEEMTIRLTPKPGNQVEMVVEGYFDPGGVVPVWAANLVQRSAPYTVMLALQRMTESPDYRSAKAPLPFPVFDYEKLP